MNNSKSTVTYCALTKCYNGMLSLGPQLIYFRVWLFLWVSEHRSEERAYETCLFQAPVFLLYGICVWFFTFYLVLLLNIDSAVEKILMK